jgi:hypothetical protein
MKKSEVVKLLSTIQKENKDYKDWMLQVRRDTASPLLSISDRMDLVVAGILIGVLPTTAMSVVGIQRDSADFRAWISEPENRAKLATANACAEASLEVTVYQLAHKNPELGSKILDKRNPGRWIPVDVSGSGERGMGLASVLARKENKVIEGVFDV